jgi:hypothetical protein
MCDSALVEKSKLSASARAVSPQHNATPTFAIDGGVWGRNTENTADASPYLSDPVSKKIRGVYPSPAE